MAGPEDLIPEVQEVRENLKGIVAFLKENSRPEFLPNVQQMEANLMALFDQLDQALKSKDLTRVHELGQAISQEAKKYRFT